MISEIEQSIFRTESKTPFCQGCGIEQIVNVVGLAMQEAQVDLKKTTLVTDIGCFGSGSDRLFACNTMHTSHGRAIGFARALKEANNELKVVVFIGDGGISGIGANHLVRTAQENVDITVVVGDNFNYGMTGGQLSPTAPLGARTKTSAEANPKPPVDICKVAEDCGASFVARTVTTSQDFYDIVSRAINHKGFSIIDAISICPTHFAKEIQKHKGVNNLLLEMGLESGVLVEKPSQPDLQQTFEQSEETREPFSLVPLEVKYQHRLGSTPRQILIAGDAGEGIVFAGKKMCEAAIMSGAGVSTSQTHPIWQKAGYSLCDIILSPDINGYTGPGEADTIVVLSENGLSRILPKIRNLKAGDQVYIDESLELPFDLPAGVAVHKISYGEQKLRKGQKTIAFVTAVFDHLDLLPLEAFQEALLMEERRQKQNLAAYELGLQAQIQIK